MISGDTIAAIATAPGRGGVAVVRVSGPEAFTIAERLTGRKNGEADASPLVGLVSIRFPGSGRGIASPLIDTGLLLAFKSPHSYTGEDVVEFQCHGGAVTPRRVLEACLAAGARLARRGEFTERAFLNGKIGYDQAESVLDLVDAKTSRAADAALEGLSGRRRRALRTLYEAALDLSVRLEHALDIDEGELPDDFLSYIRSSLITLHSSLREAIVHVNEGRLLRDGALVVLAGPPNAGKSSLMNALLETNRTIVSDVPGTTRDSIEEWIDLAGWPIRLTDTAGLRETKDEVEGEGVRRAEDLIRRADVVVWLSSPPSLFPAPSSLPVHPKCDLGRGEGLNVSAKTGEGLEDLKRAIVAKLEEKVGRTDSGEAPEGDVVALREALALLGGGCETRGMRPGEDLVLLANAVRAAAERLGTAVGATYSADMLDNLFSRFCIGK
ncbi:MAG: tRNA uridine-5-carboxymethylaminomethyl(34) synthesis GTPase MnmE [Kiritimatiellae bacterium]|nr:tRNA uridine-5-carboxymethylaminomethyl(34) synthesis GTPase MnmE [Kiritimatiellia bacterium]